MCAPKPLLKQQLALDTGFCKGFNPRKPCKKVSPEKGSWLMMQIGTDLLHLKTAEAKEKRKMAGAPTTTQGGAGRVSGTRMTSGGLLMGPMAPEERNHSSNSWRHKPWRGVRR